MIKHINKLAFLVAVLSIYSCSTTSDFSVVKRKYNSGYNLSFGGKVNTVVGSEASENKTTKQLVVKEESKTATPVTESLITENSDATITNKEITSKEIEKNTIVSSKTSSPTKLNLVQKIAIKKAEKAITKFEKNAKKNSSSQVSDETILLIILSLFPIFALLAIFWKDGKKITTNFWVDLILHFVFLYWLFALLVVLDVINLA